MPAKLDRCVDSVKADGKSEDSAYAICVDSTGIKKKKGGGWTKGDVKEIIRQCINEVLGDVVSTPTESYGLGYSHGVSQVSEQDDFVQIMKGDDPTAVGGFNYRLTECGVDTRMGYDNGKHTLMVRRDHLPMATDTLINTGDELGEMIGKKLEERYFNKKDEKINNGQRQN